MTSEARFCIRCGTPLVTASHFGKDRPSCPACSWIAFEDPKVAAAVLLRGDDRVLLVRRANDPQRGLWTLPAGFVDAHEDAREAARRECLEETGLSVEIGAIIDVISGREHERGADIVLVYRGKVLGGTLRPGDDASEVQWCDMSELPPLAFRATSLALRARM